MMKLFASMTAAAIVLTGVVFIAKGKSEHEAARQTNNPLQMMANQQHLSGQRLTDRSLVFEQAPDTEDKR
jgi:hypothetical protein